MRILSIDASLNCPGFAVMDIIDGKVDLIMTTAVDNSHPPSKKHPKKSTAEKLQEIAGCFYRLLKQYEPDVIVRERGFSRHSATTQLLFRVVGVLDLVAINNASKEIEEIPPKEVKLTMTGSGTADKTLVATSLAYYVGQRPYVTDDESDAVAVGITYAIKNGLVETKLVKKVVRNSGRPKKGARPQRMVMPHENMRYRHVRRYSCRRSARKRIV